jgi:predicted ATPase
MNNLRLKNIKIKGYKSISPEGQDIPISDITVFLGANGAGKSNIVSFFQMLNYMTSGSLQSFIGQSGSANSLLFFGSKNTTRVSAEITFADNVSKDIYFFSLSHAAGDTLIFTEETLEWHDYSKTKPFKVSLDPGVKESGLYNYCKNENAKTARIIYNLLKKCQVFQFHDTSKEAKIRNSGYINDNAFLKSNGGNLAAFLYSIKNKKDGDKYYDRIVRYVQQAFPQFGDFVLQPSVNNKNYIILNWMESDSDYLFGPHQLSDGTLRFMALATLFLQPPESLPSVIILDEPELGLHPAAISILAGMIKSVSQNCQVILATQSTRLIDEFEPGDIIVVDRDKTKKCSIFRKLDKNKVREWLETYSMSELWEKNVIGGRP